MKTTIITPTTGNPLLEEACRSVARQVAPPIHLICVDGPDGKDAVYDITTRVFDEFPNTYNYRVITLPWNTGAGGVNGHRIYASMANISITPYFSMLDEDNYLAVDWTLTMQRALDYDESCHYVTCRRTVVDEGGEVIGLDNTESVGPSRLGYALYDTNTFMMRSQIAMMMPQMARRYYTNEPDKRAGDRDLTELLLKVPHKHIDHYHGTFYRAPQQLTQFFKEICDEA